MDITVMLTALVGISALFILGYTVHMLLVHYLVVDPTLEEEAPEEDAVQYTAAFEAYWLWTANNTGIPNIFLSDRVKPVAFAAWQAAFRHMKSEVL